MRKFLFSVLILLTSINAFALGGVSNQGVIPSLTVGGRVFTDLSNLITLVCYNGANNNSTCRKPNATSGYQVTSGKTLTVYAADVMNNTTSNTTGLHIVQSDNDVGISSATAFTNPLYCDAGGTFYLPAPRGASNPVCPIAATKYTGITVTTGAINAAVILYGYEQ